MATAKFTPRSGVFSLGVLALALEGVSAVALLATSAYLISRAAEQPPIMYLMTAVVGVRAFALGRAAFRYLQRLGLHDSVFAMLAKLRPKVFANLSRLKRVESASALERVTTDLDSIQDWTLRILGPVLQAGFAFLTAFLVVFVWFPASAFTALVIGLAITALMFYLSYLTTKNSSLQRSELASRLRTEILEFITNSELLRSYGLMEQRLGQIRSVGESLAATDKKNGKTLGLAAALMGLGGITAVVASGMLSDIRFGVVPDHLLALAVLTPLAVFDVASNLQQSAIALHRFRVSRDRIGPIIDATEESNSREIVIHQLSSIELDQLSIERDRLAIQDFSCQLDRQGVTVLSGPSGSGKTSVALAIMQLIDYRGRILINNSEAGQITLESLRSLITLIEQRPRVFLGSVYENLAISGVLDSEPMLEALNRVGLEDELRERGILDLVLTEDGANLSGGQSQRLAIARALLAGAQYIIMDEPTSGLDWENSLRLIALIHELNSEGIGFLVISHDQEFSNLLKPSARLNLLAD